MQSHGTAVILMLGKFTRYFTYIRSPMWSGVRRSNIKVINASTSMVVSPGPVSRRSYQGRYV